MSESLIVVDIEKLIAVLTDTFAGGYKLAKENMPLDKKAINLGFRTMVMEGLIKKATNS